MSHLNVESRSASQSRPAAQTMIIEPVANTNRTLPRKTNSHRQATRVSTSQAYNKFPLAKKNQIFTLIANGNIAELEKLLGAKQKRSSTRGTTATATTTATTTNKHTSRAHLPNPLFKKSSAPAQSKEQGSSLDGLILQFFQGLEPEALRQLSREAEAKYFIALLHACSYHTRYQLSITDNLYPLIIYLDLEELKIFFPELHAEDGLGIYRDHRALMRLVDAINIRMIIHPDELPTLSKLRIELIKRGIEFHANHRHVINKLITLQGINAVLLDDEGLEVDDSDFSLFPMHRMIIEPPVPRLH